MHARPVRVAQMQENVVVMSAGDVCRIIERLESRGIAVWLDGGWGVDALLGDQHRDHDDLDLVIELINVPTAMQALAELGLLTAEDFLPTRVVLRSARGLQIDFHPVTFDSSGTGWQTAAGPNGSDCAYPADGFVVGRVNGVAVACLAAEVQLLHHLGYEPRPHDRADMRRLAAQFDLDLPAPYMNE